MKQHIYADNAATTKLDNDAYKAMVPWLSEEYGNASQPYSFARKPKKALVEDRETIAKCINALPEEIYFTSGGTESDNWAIKGSAFSDSKKRAMITSAIEHHAVLNSCKAIEALGYPVLYLAPDNLGIVSPENLERIITDNTRLVSIMFSNNEIGTIEPIKELVNVAHKHGSLFHTDAVQAVGHVKIDVRELGVDMLSASAHKFNGPKGIGFLYIKNGTPIEAYQNGGSQESGMRAGTENIASIVAMASALKNNCKCMAESESKLKRMTDIFLHILDEARIDYLFNGSKLRTPGNINISIKDCDGEMLLHRLDLKGICISTGAACDSVETKVSHVIKAIGVPKEYARGTIRLSFGKYNKEEDAEIVALSLIDIIKTSTNGN